MSGLEVCYIWGPSWYPRPVLPLKTKWMSTVSAAAWNHADVHGQCCCWRSHQCRWLILPLGPRWFPGPCCYWEPSLDPWSYCNWVCVDVWLVLPLKVMRMSVVCAKWDPQCHQESCVGSCSYCYQFCVNVSGWCCHQKPGRCSWFILQSKVVWISMILATLEGFVWVCSPTATRSSVSGLSWHQQPCWSPWSVLPWM